MIIGLIIGIIGAIGIGLYIYKKKNQDDEEPEGGSDDKYQMFIWAPQMIVDMNRKIKKQYSWKVRRCEMLL